MIYARANRYKTENNAPPECRHQAGRRFDLEILEDGRIVLVPVEPVPRHQLWAWTSDAKQSIVASLPIRARLK